MATTNRNFFEIALKLVAFFGGVALILSGIGVLGWQCFSWLQDAIWYPVSFADGWTAFFAYLDPVGTAQSAPREYKFKGIGEIVRWIGECPCSVCNVVIGSIMIAMTNA